MANKIDVALQKIRDTAAKLGKNVSSGVSNTVKYFIDPTSNNGQNFWSTPVAQKLGEIQQRYEQGGGIRQFSLPHAMASGQLTTGVKPIDFLSQNVGAYMKNAWVEPALQIPSNIKQMVKGQTPLEKAKGAGKLGLNVLSAVPDPTEILLAEYNLIKGVSASKLKGEKDVLKSALKSVTWQETPGLGEALTTNPTGQTVGNIAELPLMLLAGGIKAKKVDENTRLVSQAIKEGKITLEEGQAILEDLAKRGGKIKIKAKPEITKIKIKGEPMAEGSQIGTPQSSQKIEGKLPKEELQTNIPSQTNAYTNIVSNKVKNGEPPTPEETVLGGVNPKENLKNQNVVDLQKGNIKLPIKPASEISTPTKTNEVVSSTPIIPQKGRLNIGKLKVSGAGKELLQEQEAGVVPTVIGNKEVVDMARTAKGTGTLSDETMKKLMAQQLKNRQMVVDYTKQYNEAKANGASETELAKIMLNIADQSKVARERGTFAGRLLQAQNILADESASPMQKVFALLDNAGVDETKYIKDAVKVDWDNPSEVVNFYRKYVPPKFGEVLTEVRYSNMLSSPLTHIINTASNALQTGAVAPLEKTIRGTLDWGKSTLTGSQRRYYASAGIDYAGGYVKALPKAFSNFKKVMSGEEVLMKPDYERMPLGNKGILAKYTFPLRALEGMDQFFKTLVESGVTSELKKSPQKLSETQIASKATKEANYRLFRQAFDPNGELGQGYMLQLFDKWNSAIANLRRLPGGKWILPFLQTPTNILKQGLEYSPAGYITMIGAKEPVEQLAKAIMGSAVFTTAYALAKAGLTTWSAPVSGSERDLYYAAGMQPYSIKIGDKFVSYSKLGPLSYPIAMATALANAEKTNPDKKFIQNLGEGIMGILGFFGDQSYVRSIGDLVNAIKGGTNITSSAVSSEAANLIGQLIPYRSFLTWLGRITDPTYRKADGFVEKMIKDLPIIGSNLEAYKDLQGNPSKRDYPLLNAVSPYKVAKEKEPESSMLKTLVGQKISNAVEKRADEAFMQGNIEASNTGYIYRYVEDGTLKKIDTSKVTSMPENTEYQKALKSSEAYKLVDNILDSTLPEDKQQQALTDLGISVEDATYYNVARQNNDLKGIYVEEDLKNPKYADRNEMLKYLVSLRREVNGDMVLANGVVDQLYNDGFITDSERDQLKKITFDKNGKIKISGRGKKITIKKVSIPETKKIAPVKIESMGQLLQMKSYKPKKYQLDLKKYRLNYK